MKRRYKSAYRCRPVSTGWLSKNIKALFIITRIRSTTTCRYRSGGFPLNSFCFSWASPLPVFTGTVWLSFRIRFKVPRRMAGDLCKGGGMVSQKFFKMKMNDYIRFWDNSNRRWQYEHRLIMQNKLGRKLLSSEHVHHIDGDPKNNNPENLMIVSAEEHIRIHKPAVKRNNCCLCNRKHHARGFCKAHYKAIFLK